MDATQAAAEQAAAARSNSSGADVDVSKSVLIGDVGQGMIALGVAAYSAAIAFAKFQKAYRAR